MLRQERDTLRDTVIQNAVTKNLEKEHQKRELENLKSSLLKNAVLKAETDEKVKELSRMKAKYDELIDHMEKIHLSYAKSKATIERLRSDVSKTVNYNTKHFKRLHLHFRTKYKFQETNKIYFADI